MIAPQHNHRDSYTLTALRPCPNVECAEEDDLELRAVQSHIHVVCRGCHMRGPGADSKPGAVETWNDLPRLD
jgi:hypothetical protein